MSNDLAIIESNLTPLAPRFEAVMGGVMKSTHLIQTVLVSIERNPSLLKCSMQSIVNGAMTFANLRLPVDGATGQGFLLPFKGIAQPVIGYKGFNTIGARSGLTITGGIVREGDEFDYAEGTGGFVRHKRMLDNPGRIIAGWAVAESKTRPNAVAIMGIGELTEIMQRSPAVKNNAKSPWDDVKVGRPAMFEKSVKRRLGRILPFEIDDGRFLQAARIDEAFDENGKHSFIDDRGALMIEGETKSPIAPSNPAEPPDAEELMGGRRDNDREQLYKTGMEKAREGTPTFWKWWDSLTKPQQLKMKPDLEALRAVAESPGGSQ